MVNVLWTWKFPRTSPLYTFYFTRFICVTLLPNSLSLTIVEKIEILKESMVRVREEKTHKNNRWKKHEEREERLWERGAAAMRETSGNRTGTTSGEATHYFTRWPNLKK